MATLVRIAEDAARLMGQGARASDPGDRMRAYREAAGLLVDAREHFLDADGDPDWRGRTYDYRRWAADVYSSSGVTGGERSTMTAAVRYHVGNILRERLDAGSLEALGLLTDSPRERSAEQRAEKAALLRSVTGSSSGFRGVDGLRAVVSARALLERVDTGSLAALTGEERDAAVEAVDGIGKRLDALRRAVRPRRKP